MRELEIAGKKVAAVASGAPLDFLGRLAWYSVPKATVPFDILEKRLEDEDVPEELRPHRTRPSSAFKLAVREAGESAGYFVTYDVVEDNGVKRRDPHKMIVVSKDRPKGTTSLPIQLRAEFTGGAVTTTVVGGGNGLASVEKEVQRLYQAYSTGFNDGDIRKMLTDVMRACQAILVKEHGGVYFVPEQHSGLAESVSRVVEGLNTEPLKKASDFQMVAIPVIDREPERATVLRSYERDAKERLNALLVKAKVLIDDGGKVQPSTYLALTRELSYLEEQKTRYEEILETDIAAVGAETKVVRQFLMDLASQVGAEDPDLCDVCGQSPCACVK